jgi:hypothetical protein
LPAFRPGFLVAGFARLLRGAGCSAVVATLIASCHALGLRGRRPDASKHHDGSQDSNGSPKTHLSLHAVLLLVQRWFVEQIIEQEAKLGAGTNFTARCCAGFVNLNVSPVKLTV